MAHLRDLTPEQQEALCLYAFEKRRKWKQQLKDAWQRSTYNWHHPDKSCYLQQIRNQFGASWLAELKL
jgi:hypothetical protein